MLFIPMKLFVDFIGLVDGENTIDWLGFWWEGVVSIETEVSSSKLFSFENNFYLKIAVGKF